MRIEILGTGCHDCLKLDLLVAEILEEVGVLRGWLTAAAPASQGGRS